MTMDKSSFVHPKIVDLVKPTIEFTPINRAGSLEIKDEHIQQNNIAELYKHSKPLT
jgi:hypothetical protein